MSFLIRARPTCPATLALAFVLFSSVTARAQVTFAKDIAPIVFDACASCHRPGGPGPFSLTTYAEVRQRATQIAEVTRSGFMPPWKVDPHLGPVSYTHLTLPTIYSV